MGMKMIGLRLKFLRDVWHLIDAIVVFLWLLSLIGTSLPMDPTMIRLARLARLIRLMRLAYRIQAFDKLYLISTALGSSMSILGWTCVLFLLIQMMVALLLTNLLAEYYLQDVNEPLGNRQTVYTYFGTFSRSMFSMFEITLGNWPPMSRILSEHVSEFFMFFGVLHKLTVGFAFVGVVNGVFMQETFKVAATDDGIMLRAKKLMIKTHMKKGKVLQSS